MTEATVETNASNEVATAEQTSAPAAALNIPNPDKFHQAMELHYGFRTIKDEKTGTESKRPSVDIKLPVLNFDGIVQILKNYASTNANLESADEALKAAAIAAKKEYDLLQGAVVEVYSSAIKDLLKENQQITSENFPYAQFTWTAMANEPESERKGRGIAKEIWEDFLKSYVEKMPAITGKAKAHIEKQAAILGQKLNPLKNHEDKDKIIPNFENALTLYLNNAGPDAEQFSACIEFLLGKCKQLLTAEKDANLMKNLGF